MNTKLISKIACAALLAGVGMTASAETLTAQSYKGTNTSYTLYQSGGALIGNGTYTPGVTMKDAANNTFFAYCIDPRTGFTNGASTYTTMSLDTYLNGLTTSAYAQEIARANYNNMGLVNTAAKQATVLADLKELFSYAYSDSQLTATKAAAFGMALWEIILQNGSTYSGLNGTLRVNGSDTTLNNGDVVETQLANYLSALNNNTWGTGATTGLTSTNWNYTVYFDNTTPSQTFITAKAPGTVPEPATAALVLAALFAGVRARRNSQKV